MPHYMQYRCMNTATTQCEIDYAVSVVSQTRQMLSDHLGGRFVHTQFPSDTSRMLFLKKRSICGCFKMF